MRDVKTVGQIGSGWKGKAGNAMPTRYGVSVWKDPALEKAGGGSVGVK